MDAAVRAAAYLAPIKNRKNLHILTQAQTQKILFTGKRARAVQLKMNGIEQVISARREIILCAIAIGSRK